MQNLRNAVRLLVAALPGVVLALSACGGTAGGTQATIAVAANFYRAAGELAQAFEARTGHRVILVSGSTGKLYAQIGKGAPFDALLAADSERPRRLEQDGLAVAGSRFVYATGRLSLWSRDPERIAGDGAMVLEAAAFSHLAIANPQLAPYGVAAQQVLQRLGLWDRLQPRIVMGENIGQAHALVATGNAELGFVARSALAQAAGGSQWPVPAGLHEPIRQDAVLLQHGADNTAARAFLAFVRGAAGRSVIRTLGYGSE